jgi:hypothetical protein
MSDDTSRTYPSGAQEFKSIFSGVHVVCVVFTCFVLCCDIFCSASDTRRVTVKRHKYHVILALPYRNTNNINKHESTTKLDGPNIALRVA